MALSMAAVTFAQAILAVHIIAVVVAFGVLFSYPLFMLVGARLEPSAMAWFHRMQVSVSRRIVSPGLLLVVICGVILASEWHAWKAFYVQWGLGASIVIGGLEGMVMIPRAGRLADLARDDTARAPSGPLGAEYRKVMRQVLACASAISLIVLVTIVIMALHVGG